MAETLTIRTASSTEVVKISSQGPQGATGQGVPVGGTTGQVLRKASGTNYDTEWATGGGGASYDQELNTTDSVTFESVTADKVAFDLAAAETAAQGELAWNADEETLDLGLAHGSVLQVGQETLYHVENSTASTITAGTLCVFSGTVGNSGKLRVAPHANNTNPTAIIGVATSTIAAGVGEEGYVTHFGKCRGINASGGAEAWANGDLLYASPTGGLTKTKPSAPIVTVAAVVSNSSSSGTLFVRPSFGQTAADVGAQSALTIGSGGTLAQDLTLTAARNVAYTYNVLFGGPYTITLPIANNQAGDLVEILTGATFINDVIVRQQNHDGTDGTPQFTTLATLLGGSPHVAQRAVFRKGSASDYGTWQALPASVHTHAASAIVSGTLDIARIPTGTGSTQVALGNHSHGNINSSGQVGSDSGRVLVTTTAGAVTTLALGTAGQVLTVNSGATGVEFAAASGGGGSKTCAVFTATDNNPPATAFATIDQRNSIAVLDFDDATDESAVFVSIIPEGASLGSGLKIRLHWMATTATSGNVVWDVSLERMTTDLDSDSFDTIASGTAAANGTSGILTVTEITLTTIDSVTAGDAFRLKVTRDANNGSDNMSGDAELVAVEARSAA